MLEFNLVLENPWGKDVFKNRWDTTKKLWGHKFLEAQLFQFNKEVFGLRSRLDWRGRDHAGPSLEIILFRHTLSIRIYDSRHWDYDNNCWMNYEEDTCQNKQD